MAINWQPYYQILCILSYHEGTHFLKRNWIMELEEAPLFGGRRYFHSPCCTEKPGNVIVCARTFTHSFIHPLQQVFMKFLLCVQWASYKGIGRALQERGLQSRGRQENTANTRAQDRQLEGHEKYLKNSIGIQERPRLHQVRGKQTVLHRGGGTWHRLSWMG